MNKRRGFRGVRDRREEARAERAPRGTTSHLVASGDEACPRTRALRVGVVPAWSAWYQGWMAKQSKSAPEMSVVDALARTGWRVLAPLEGKPSVQERRANESGQSSVWRTEHADKKAGVLKVARGKTQVDRVRREIQILRRISHPAIVPIVDADVDCEPPWLITAEGVPLVA